MSNRTVWQQDASQEIVRRSLRCQQREVMVDVPQLSGHKDSGYKDNSAPWKSLISFGAPCWSGFPEHRTARAFDEAASPPTPPSGAASSGCQRGGDREARALAMEIPLD